MTYLQWIAYNKSRDDVFAVNCLYYEAHTTRDNSLDQLAIEATSSSVENIKDYTLIQ